MSGAAHSNYNMAYYCDHTFCTLRFAFFTIGFSPKLATSNLQLYNADRRSRYWHLASGDWQLK